MVPFFDEGKSKITFSMEKVGEVFRYCAFCDTYRINQKGWYTQKGEWFLLVKANGIQDASTNTKRGVM